MKRKQPGKLFSGLKRFRFSVENYFLAPNEIKTRQKIIFRRVLISFALGKLFSDSRCLPSRIFARFFCI
jgi:hypothetical protein